MGLVVKPVYQQVAGSTSPTPVRRPMPSPQPKRIDEASLAAFGCDVSYIGGDATPAEELVTRAVEQAASHDLKHLLWETFDRLRSDYAANSPVGHPAGVATRVRQAVSAMSLTLTPDQHFSMCRFFNDVNHVLFQHQALAWLAEANLKVHLYGKGWEHHPQLARFARGVPRDERTREAIYKASKINLSVGVFGAMTPTMLEGVAAGGFFLARFCAADVIEKFYPPLVEFCVREGVHTNGMLGERATPGVRALLAFASRTLGVDVLNDWPEFVSHLMASRASSRSRSAAVVWPAQYNKMCFSSRDDLLNQVTRFLYDEPARRAVAEGMQRVLVEGPRVSVEVSRAVATARSGADEVAA